ncbi:MAG: hypothetical protein HY900_34505 [Deltaproteobacteria bacterium]|nr:hypothetical protein [Deltaproteobacteria bacterium]
MKESRGRDRAASGVPACPRILRRLILVASAACAGCCGGGANFSQYPGFAEYFLAHPPAQELPNGADRALLERFRPRLWLPAGHPGPIDFYKDYIANGFLTDGAGRLVSRNVTRELLNAHKADPGAVFVHEEKRGTSSPVVLGRVTREEVSFEIEGRSVSRPFTFLRYHFVFEASGLPAGIPPSQEAAARLLGDPEDWHQLDHYTAVTVVLEGWGSEPGRPVAVMMQQHNGVRTYLAGEGIHLPPDGRPEIDVAIRSNELYPHAPGRTRHRAVAMPDKEGMRYWLAGGSRPRYSADDVTDGAREAGYSLAFLPPDDAFYVFQGFLGERRCLPGRDGPPGADYNTRPELKPLGLQLSIGYWREGDPGDIARLEHTVGKKGDYLGFARLQGAELLRGLERMQAVQGDRARRPNLQPSAGGVHARPLRWKRSFSTAFVRSLKSFSAK